MRPRLMLVHDQEQLECFAVPESTLKAPDLAPEQEPHVFPGASRRDWVYREISQLGADAAPWVERN
ncbi:MAG TPA: hypothetical protein VLJ84_09470 [Usitatibacter sp.]|nr:hypothetical protein [Usitatibacter sp.]HST01879.1 hypothetical protein [Usitatibacter sp.]